MRCFQNKGEQAKAFFLKSGLPTPVLGQIWNLADLNKDGKLDSKEFSIACFLIKRALTSPQGPACIPATLPSSLLIDPSVSAQPSLGIAATPAAAPLIAAPPPTASSMQAAKPSATPAASATASLFQANFPPLTQTPLVGFPGATAAVTTGPMTATGPPVGGVMVLPPQLAASATTSPTTSILPIMTPASTSTPLIGVGQTTTVLPAVAAASTTATPATLPGAIFTPLVVANNPNL